VQLVDRTSARRYAATTVTSLAGAERDVQRANSYARPTSDWRLIEVTATRVNVVLGSGGSRRPQVVVASPIVAAACLASCVSWDQTRRGLAARRISEDEVHALIEDHVVVEVVEERNATGTSCSAASVAVR
jgi:hypothetical protein